MEIVEADLARPAHQQAVLALTDAYARDAMGNGRGIARQLLAAAEAKARALGCCKLTLEVQEKNDGARRLYARAGFAQNVYQEAAGGALFYAKPL